MISLKRTNQGGSVQTFIIIGLLLAVVTIGVARYVEQHGAQVRRDQAIALAEKQLKANQDKSSSSKTSEGTNAAGANSGQITAPANPNGTPVTGSTEVAAANPQQASDLPTTGPSSDVVVRVFLAGLLSAAIVGYFSSRRQLARSL